jgi:hypothetical protein
MKPSATAVPTLAVAIAKQRKAREALAGRRQRENACKILRMTVDVSKEMVYPLESMLISSLLMLFV